MKPKTLVITGAESSGKTTLAKALSKKLKLPFLPEYARAYFESTSSSYTFQDLLSIAEGQRVAQEKFSSKHRNLKIWDTDLLNISVWAADKFNTTIPWVENYLRTHPPTAYLVTSCQIPWESDPLREDSNRRSTIERLHLRKIKEIGVPFTLIKGNEKERLSIALDYLEHYL